ncbi:hypothetical protein [Phenylobacterium sp.]|uniref:hypothetical protein n=1 Tax=Phenylobacterium sp. TaxID=1871053 RepID=UPI0035B4EBA3
MTAPALDASAARAAAPPADPNAARDIRVHLTPFAPGCERRRIDDPRCWRTFYAKRPVDVIRAVLTRLERAPREVEAHQEVNGDLCLTAQAPPEIQRLINTEPGEPVVLAIVWEGLALAEWAASREALIATGWSPKPQEADA